MLALTCGFRYFENEGTSEKGCVEIEDWDFSIHFVLGFQENSIYTWHLSFGEDITEWCKSYTKADSWFQKSHEEFEKLQESLWKSKKLKFKDALSGLRQLLATESPLKKKKNVFLFQLKSSFHSQDI